MLAISGWIIVVRREGRPIKLWILYTLSWHCTPLCFSSYLLLKSCNLWRDKHLLLPLLAKERLLLHPKSRMATYFGKACRRRWTRRWPAHCTMKVKRAIRGQIRVSSSLQLENRYRLLIAISPCYLISNNPAVIPYDCKVAADGKCSMDNMEVYDALYFETCTIPWTFCRCTKSEMSQANTRDPFGMIGSKLRSYVRHVMAFPSPLDAWTDNQGEPPKFFVSST